MIGSWPAARAACAALGPDPFGPGEAHAADEERADEDHGHRPGRRVEDAGDALVAREKARNARGSRRIDAEQVARHEAREAQRAGERHVHAVVVVRREVDGRECAAREFRRQRRVAAQQCRGRIVDALGLQQRVARDPARLAHKAVGGAEGRARVCVERPRAGRRRRVKKSLKLE